MIIWLVIPIIRLMIESAVLMLYYHPCFRFMGERTSENQFQDG